jgi:hypothetical protein
MIIIIIYIIIIYESEIYSDVLKNDSLLISSCISWGNALIHKSMTHLSKKRKENHDYAQE